MLIRIKNAQKAGKKTVLIPYSQFKNEIVEALHRAGFVGVVERKGKRARRCLHITLIYKEEQPVITTVRLLSKPSRRLYIPYKNLHPTLRGGITVLTTSKGVMTSDEARKVKVGGQLIAEIW